MKVTIRDIDALKAMQPLEFAAYLRANGWRESECIPNRSSIWTLGDDSNEEYEILLPLRRDFRDFANRISDAVQTLEVAEQRSQLEILRDLTKSGGE